MPHLSEAAQELVASYGGWWRYLEILKLNSTVREDVEKARKVAEDGAVLKVQRKVAAVGL